MNGNCSLRASKHPKATIYLFLAGQYRSELRRGILLARSKIKDPDISRQLEIDIQGKASTTQFMHRVRHGT